MKILMLLWDYYPGPEGGAERQCRKLVHAMSTLGHTCSVIASRYTLRISCQEYDGAVAVYRPGALTPLFRLLSEAVGKLCTLLFRSSERAQRVFGFWLTLPFVWSARLSFLMGLWCLSKKMTGAYDVIHVHESGWLAGVGVWLGERLGIPVVCKVRNTPALEVIGYDIPFRMSWGKLRRKAHFIALHEALRKELREDGIAFERISVIPNGVELPNRLDRSRNPEEVLYVGNFSQGAAHKGCDVLISAWSVVHKFNPAARLTLVGGGDCRMWKRMALASDCLDSISFEGAVTAPEKYYCRASLFVLPSRHEGMSNALLEAQSYGLPAVVSDIPANRAVIDHDVNGWRYAVEDTNALANMILLLLEGPEKRAQMADAAVDRIKQDFEIGVVCTKLLALYEEERHDFRKKESILQENAGEL